MPSSSPVPHRVWAGMRVEEAGKSTTRRSYPPCPARLPPKSAYLKAGVAQDEQPPGALRGPSYLRVTRGPPRGARPPPPAGQLLGRISETPSIEFRFPRFPLHPPSPPRGWAAAHPSFMLPRPSFLPGRSPRPCLSGDGGVINPSEGGHPSLVSLGYTPERQPHETPLASQ